ncbi:nicotinate-nucleotide adenylyltransferase [Halocynthiibacter namhaensis]|uniref:nicotinate-nucleotide adenylyltransferase n=1 Tax=Halocynthiibacter namhaensis TaxID=1290553 RepID=UPI00057991FC|nr:nicotinate-nucleotide adenylyltransferase [Halocynthiibacter namhaensis]
MRFHLPHAPDGATIGLLGGSFDPPHEGHLHISEEALKRFGLDQVWWLVTPGNPLKSRGPAPLPKRMEACKTMLHHPRIQATDFERHTNTRYTAQTLQALFQTYPRANFVWLMGADNLASFHHWDNWQWIMENVPIGVIARPGQRTAARTSFAAKRFDFARISGKQSHRLAHATTPAWCFINAPMNKTSSTQIRNRGNWAS